eukprot:scaffold9468_cov130-Skeletonema_dohrnii-CCMP3373.AAC.5
MNLHMQLSSGRLFKAPAPAAGRDRRRMAMTDVTNVLIAGMSHPPNIVRTMNASDDFDDIIHAPATKFQYQDCSPPWPHYDVEQQQQQQQPSYQRRASHRRLHAMDYYDIVSTTQAYPSHGVANDVSRPTPTRKFEQLRDNTHCNQRTSRSSDFHSSHATFHTQKYPSVSSSSKQLYNRHRHHCSQNSQDTVKPSFIVPSNISDLISDLNAKAKLLSREEEEEYDDSSSLDYSSDDSMIEAAIYKSVAPPPPSIKQHQEQSTGGTSMKDLICAVCLDFPDDPKHIASVSGCTHRFCFSCIDSWAKRGNNECPLCKSTFHLIASGDRVRWY